MMWLGMMPVMAGHEVIPCDEADVGKIAGISSPSGNDKFAVYLSKDQEKPTIFLHPPFYFFTCMFTGEIYQWEHSDDKHISYQIKDEDGNYYGNRMKKNRDFDCRDDE